MEAAPPSYAIREDEPADETFLRDMLYETVNWRPGSSREPREEVLRDPHLARYLRNWERLGDAAVVAARRSDGLPVGAA